MSISKGDASDGGVESIQNDGRLSEDEVFEVFSNQRRRYTFHYLKRADRTVYLRELAEQVASWEYDKPIDELTSKELKRVKTALHQHHLPKMDDSDFVAYDNQRETVEITDEAADLTVYLDVVPQLDVPWSLYYVGLATLGMAVLLGKWANVTVLSGVRYSTLTIVFTTAYLLSGLVHTYINHSRHQFGGAGEPPDRP